MKVAEIVDSTSFQGELDSPGSDSRRSVRKSCVQMYNEERGNKENLPENNLEVLLEERPPNNREWLGSNDNAFFQDLIDDEERLENYIEQTVSGLPQDSESISELAPPAKKPDDWSSYTPTYLRTPRHEALRTTYEKRSSENPTPRRNTKRSYQQYNENLATKGNVMKLQEQYFKSLVQLQVKEEARKNSEIEWMKKKQKLEENEYQTRTRKLEEFWDLKIKYETENFEREKLYDEHLYSLKVKMLDNAEATTSKS